jgi:hypothetical protein
LEGIRTAGEKAESSLADVIAAAMLGVPDCIADGVNLCVLQAIE